jgi:microcystin-dependent protein
MHNIEVQNTGGGQPHTIEQPFLALNAFIKY